MEKDLFKINELISDESKSKECIEWAKGYQKCLEKYIPMLKKEYEDLKGVVQN